MTAPGLSKCIRCAGDLEYDREIEEAVREGNNVALVAVRADVCLRCGEEHFHPGMVERIARAREALRRGPAAPPVGQVYDLRAET